MTTSARPGAGGLVRRLIVPLAAMIIAFGAGWSLGAGNQKASWQDAKVKVTGTTAEVTTDGTTYPIDGGVPSWIDTKGGQHSGGWPACLTALDGSSGSLKVVVSNLTVGKSTIDAVMAVDCRS